MALEASQFAREILVIKLSKGNYQTKPPSVSHVALKAPNIFLTWTFDLIYGKSNARLCVQK
jgi:hypothetical protein